MMRAESFAPESLRMQHPQQVFLFSGHMIDRKGRNPPRFMPENEPLAARAIATRLDELGASSGSLGITQGACGGDLLFAEAMLARKARLALRLPFDRATFLKESVSYEKDESRVPDRWESRFHAVASHPGVEIRTMPEELGPLRDGEDPFQRCNLWMLDEALSLGIQRLHFICLWNGAGGDGPGGTQNMRDEVLKRGGTEHWLDTTRLWSA